MCGILALLLNSKNKEIDKETRKHLLQMSRNLRHRGPDASGFIETKTGLFAHERLSIIDPFGGSQPIEINYGFSEDYGHDEHIILTVNGEIYNHKELRERFENDYEFYYDGCGSYPYKFKTGSDCEVIIPLYLKKKFTFSEETTHDYDNHTFTHEEIVDILDQLDGQFSFVLHDVRTGNTLVARDPFGITPLYYGIDAKSNILFASEMKALESCVNVFPFEPGHYMFISGSKCVETHLYEKKKTYKFTPAMFREVKCIPYFQYTDVGSWVKRKDKVSVPTLDEKYHYKECKDESYDYSRMIREKFEEAVHKRLMADVPFGVLLSGGLDSSLVASITQRYFKAHPEFNPYIRDLNSFSIGLEDSPDLKAAQRVADYIGTRHHNFTFTVQEGINALRDVIYHLETPDITTVRASTPMYLLSRKVKSLGIKMVLSGEGSDELLGGYLYFHNAPSDEAHQLECKRRLLQLGYFDCLRANKSTMSWGLEARTPFLDKEFVASCIELPKDLKGTMKHTDTPQMEKHCIRSAFDMKDANGKQVYLPEDILWRQKEQFSDGVGYSWIDDLKTYTEKQIDTYYIDEWNFRQMKYPVNTPDTKEALYYRIIFDELFPGRASTFKKWVPMTEWEGVGADPSGRAQSVHVASKQIE